MSPAAPTDAGVAATPAASSWRAVPAAAWRASRAAGWRDPALALAIGLACLLFMAGPLQPGAGQRNWTVPALYNILQFGVPMVLAIRLADAAVDRGLAAWLAYSAVAAAVPVAGVWLFGPALTPVLGSDPGWTLVNDLWLFSGVSILLGIGTAVYAHWRAGERALVRHHAAEAERLTREQRLHVARLLALQARVDPPLLFATLHTVRERAGHDGAAAEALLTELIALLRALLPSVQAANSTLGRELALVQAQARLLAQAMPPPAAQGATLADAAPPEGERVAPAPLPLLLADLAPEAAEAEFGPLVLPGLLRLLAAAGVGGSWTLSARRDDTGADAEPMLQLELQALTSSGTGDAPTIGLSHDSLQRQALALQEKLQSVHGSSARLELLLTAEARRACIALPWRRANVANLHPAEPPP